MSALGSAAPRAPSEIRPDDVPRREEALLAQEDESRADEERGLQIGERSREKER